MNDTMVRWTYPSYIRPDTRIIEAFQSLVRIINRTTPQAELSYIEAAPHPLTNSGRVQTGLFMGRNRRLEDYTPFLGEHGYFEFMKWRTRHISDSSAQINLQIGQDSIWVTSPTQDKTHAFGFEGTRFHGDRSDLDLSQARLLRHFVRNQNHLIKSVMDILGGAVN